MTMTHLLTMQQAAEVADYTYATLRVIAHKGEFIEPDLVIGSSHLFHPKRVRAWKQKRERMLRKRKT
jgi:hypothetical protein